MMLDLSKPNMIDPRPQSAFSSPENATRIEDSLLLICQYARLGAGGIESIVQQRLKTNPMFHDQPGDQYRLV